MEEILDSWINAISRVDPYKIVAEVINSHSRELIEENQAQLKSGTKGDGSRLSPYTAAYARKEGKSINNKDLYRTGALYDDMYVSSAFDVTVFGSRDFKAKFHEAKEGEDIFGIPVDKIRNIIVEDFAKKYLQAIGGYNG